MKLLVLIFSCKKYLLSRIDKLKNIGYLDCFDKKSIDYLIIVGNEKMSEEYILQKNILTVKVDDSYKGFPNKIIKTFNIINNIYNYDCVIKTDDDCLLNIDKIQENIDYIKKYDYIGTLNNFPHQYCLIWNGLDNSKSTYLGPYMNGANGYVLSKKALETISNSKEQINKLLLNELYEDKLIGDILRLNGYNFIKHDIWNSKALHLTEINSYKKLIETPSNFIKISPTDNCNSYISFFQHQ